MSHRTTRPGRNPVAISLCLMSACVLLAVFCAATAHAGNYKMLLCAGNNGAGSYQTATNTTSAQNPGGIFAFQNACGAAPDPAGSNAFLRIVENQGAGNAGVGAYGSMSWGVTPAVAILAGGGYTREPNAFNDGWRARFWLEGWDGSTNNALMQGSGVANNSLGGIGWATTSTFAPHLWPFGGYGDYRRFVFEMTCYRQAGCDRSNFNAADANTLNLTLADRQDPSVSLAASGVLGGAWVRGTQQIGWSESEQGSGLRFSRLKLDGAVPGGGTIDYAGACDLGWTGTTGEFARRFDPCPTGGPYQRSYGLDTASLSDGPHTLAVCLQDYGQARSGGETCATRTIRTDNTAPGKPASLEVTSSNPARYLPRFGARLSLPSNSGSPIAKVRYRVTDETGEVVVPEKTVAATNPSALSGIEGPAKPGAYTLHLALEDEVGHLGAAATAPIPHDTTPPAAPQDLRVVGTAARRVATFDLRWDNVADDGSPITAARYQVIDSSGAVVTPTQAVSAENVEKIAGIATPAAAGDYRVRVWLVDEEGNVGAASTVAVPRDTTPPAAPQDISVAAPSLSRAERGLDVRWRNIADDGSPIAAAHYRVLDGAGREAVPTTTISGPNVESIADLDTPRGSGAHTLVLWLSDGEGNVGAPVRVPLSYECVRSDQRGADSLTAGLGSRGRPELLVSQGRGALLRGRLTGGSGGVGGAPVCVFSRVATSGERRFLGLAVTDPGGGYEFAIGRGASREIAVAHRDGQREATASATLRVRVRPTFKARSAAVRNGGFAVFRGRIPGPDNARVVVVLQVRSGEGWRVFRRYRTRAGGRYVMRYRFTRTRTPVVYVMRAQVRRQSGYPYEQGNSRRARLRVMP